MELIYKILRIGLVLCLTLAPYGVGKAFLLVFGGKRAGGFQKADCLLTGYLIGIGLAEAAHLAAVFGGRSFSDAVLLFCVGMTVLLLASVGILLWKRFRENKGERRKRKRRRGLSPEDTKPRFSTFSVILFLVFAGIVVYQLVMITCLGNVYRSGDMTVETVQSFLETNGIYRVNPLTGRAYESGIPLRLKILCLPTLYAVLCRLFAVPAAQLVWKVIPTVVLLSSYLAFYLLADVFFPDEKNRVKRSVFMVVTALVFCLGDYLYGMDGFGLLYSGFRGVTIRNMVLLPYVFGLMLRRRPQMTVLCILAEGCIVWTLYGMGSCLFAAAGMTAVSTVTKIWGKRCDGLQREN